MDPASGRSLTSFRGGTRNPTTVKADDATTDDGPFMPNALDFAFRAFMAENTLGEPVPPVFSNRHAVDSASFVGRGASFTVYRRRIPPQKATKSSAKMGGVLMQAFRKRNLPNAVAYKVAVIEFSDNGEATHKSRHAIDAAIMELYLSTHGPIRKHPNIVSFLGLGWTTSPFNILQRLPVLIVELAEYGSLSYLQQKEYLGIETRRKICLDVCSGLHTLHSCGIVHGDIKADNVLIFPDAEHKYMAKLSDFGHSLVMDTERSSVVLGGTRPWKAPEAKGTVKVADAKYTDIYSLSLFIWCTFAHGQNIFKLLVNPSEHGEALWTEAEKLKETQALADLTAIPAWYFKANKASHYGCSAQPTQQLQSLQQHLQQSNAQAKSPIDHIDGIEKILCAIPPMSFSAVEPLVEKLIATVQASGLYDAMERAVKIGLSNDPPQRHLGQIMVALGHIGFSTEDSAQPDHVLRSKLNEHMFTWRHWTGMEPSVQRYLTRTYIQRCEEGDRRGTVNPGETLLLTALYINGYGVDKDESQAIRWLLKSWEEKDLLAPAYGYRIARSIGHQFDNMSDVIESLEEMAMRGSRTALEDLAIVSKDTHEKSKKNIRCFFACTGANFFLDEELLRGVTLHMWLDIFRNIPVLIKTFTFSRSHAIADYSVNKRGDRILHIAASCGHTEAIEALLNHFPVLQVDQLNDQGETPLLSACRAGQTDTVLWLTSRGATASVSARNGESPLHWLISFDDQDIESVSQALIQAGADPNARTASGIAYQSGFPSSIDVDRLPQGLPIGWATHCDRPQIVKVLLCNMANPCLCDVSPRGQNSALAIAAWQHRSECLELMLHTIDQFLLERRAPQHLGYHVTQLLQRAVYGSSLFDTILYHGPKYRQALKSTLEYLLPRVNKCANTSGYGGFNQTLLYMAVSLARDEFVGCLLEHGTELMKAAETYDERLIQSQDFGAFKPSDINRECGFDLRTPLLEAVQWNRPTMVNLLLDHGAHATGASRNPFSGQSSTWTALHVLAYGGQDDTRLVQTLLDHGAPLDGFSDNFDSTESPLLVAVQSDSFQLANNLLSHGADINFTTLSSGHLKLTHPTTVLGHLIASNARNSIARLRYVLGSAYHVDFIVEPARHRTALHRAAAAYIDAEFRGTNATESARLDWADVDWGSNREILNELLRHFYDQEQLDAVEGSLGLTAMHLAVLAGNDAAVKLLLDRGARSDILSEDGQGTTAADMALELQMERLSTSEEGAQPGEAEVTARKRCSDLLNP